MASTTTPTSPTASSPTHRKRTAVPILLESFPVPPSHIPPTPTIPSSSLPAFPFPPPSTTNPPPSRPPSTPLPPVPGPSRIADTSTLQLLSRSSRYSSSSRRSSAVGADEDGRRSSTASNASASSLGYLRGGNRDSVASRSSSLRSLPPRSPSSFSHHSAAPPSSGRPSIAYSIHEDEFEDDAERDRVQEEVALASGVAVARESEQLTDLPMPSFDDDDDPAAQNASTSTLRFGLGRGRATPVSIRSKHVADESISSIDVREIMQNDWDDDDPENTDTFSASLSFKRPSSSASAPLPASASSNRLPLPDAPSGMRTRQISIADPIDPQGMPTRSSIDRPIPRAPLPRTPTSAASTDTSTPTSSSTIIPDAASSSSPPPVDPQSLHLQMRAARSRSASHKQALRARSTSPSRARASTYPVPVPAPPIPSLPKQEVDGRKSPDIDDILARTPRPVLRRKSQAKLSRSQSRNRPSSNGTRSRVTSATDSVLSRSSAGWGVENVGDDDLAYIVSGSWRKSGGGGSDEDYGVPVGNGSTPWEDDEDGIRRLERELDGDGSESDSSIDLHTPLPNLMLRHGLLSPNSKLLPQQSRAGTPLDGRPGSGLSMASVGGASLMTKSGIFKDERDTPNRRVRHRDGKLLRGGIGLTTGLGWSDSEDEDAPSPLTRRLSALNLSRRSSASSMNTTPRPHPLSRSFSSGVLSEEFDNSAFEKKSRLALPPTSWKKTGGAIRDSTSSNGSSKSADAFVATRTPRLKTQTSRPGVDVHGIVNRRSGDDPALNTPSSASTLSIPLPVTPSDDSQRRVPMDKDKSLPPLPLSTLKKYPSNLSIRSRAISTGSNPSALSSGLPSLSASTPPVPNVRPLRLPQQPSRISTRGDRPAVPVPSVGSYAPVRTPSISASGLSTPQSTPTTPTTPSGIAKPKPRTGTGMVYRTSSGPASRMRAPMSLSASLSASTGSLPPLASRPTTPGTRGVAY